MSDSIDPEFKSCTIRVLPDDEQVPAAARAIAHNPANAPSVQMLEKGAPGTVIEPQHLALLTASYWGPAGVRLTVSFLEKPGADPPSAELRARILSHMNAWGAYSNVHFTETASGGQVRITRTMGPPGYWSYLGTDVLSIPLDQPTMKFEGFTMETPDSEFHRVVRHEAGHTLGFPHEHATSGIVSRIDPDRAYKYFSMTQGWDRREVDQQVLTPLEKSALIATDESDPLSIMCYALPGYIMRDRKAVLGGTDINATDGEFAGAIYPLALLGGNGNAQAV
ncbi:peptidase M12 [Candidatus Bathyarchaeota archaeon]|nr:peptidase M12 [Candidatus Bathyarchaeota archaeon]